MTGTLSEGNVSFHQNRGAPWHLVNVIVAIVTLDVVHCNADRCIPSHFSLVHEIASRGFSEHGAPNRRGRSGRRNPLINVLPWRFGNIDIIRTIAAQRLIYLYRKAYQTDINEIYVLLFPRTRPGALLILAHRPRNLGNRDGVHAGLLRNPPLEKMHLRLVGGREGEGREPIAMLIPNNLPGIVGPARSIITSASLLRRAVRPPTRKSEFAYLVDRGDRFCRKGVGIPRRSARFEGGLSFFILSYS